MSYSNEYRQQVLESVNKASFLLTELHRSGSSFGDTIQSIISASRLEGHADVSRLAELVYIIVEALNSGSLDPHNEDINSVIGAALAEIIDIINNNRHSANPKIEERMKAILRSAKSDELDYVYNKTLKVLYVDEDRFAQSNIQKNIGKSIQIESCLSGEAALQRLKTNKFDAILCDLKLTDPDICKIFAEYSAKIPIVAVSTSDDPRLVQLATKTGALDFITKNDTAVRRIPKSLHTVNAEWIKTSKLSDISQLLKNQNSQKILKYLVEADSTIKQKIDCEVLYDWKPDETIKDMNAPLESLVKAGYILKQSTELILSCPMCNSHNIRLRYLCQKCNNSDFIKGDVLEHNKCGYSGLEDKFKVGDALVCPKCRKQLKLIGVDYSKAEAAYTCSKCSHFFTTPDLRYSCNVCGHDNFRISDGKWTGLFTYRINPDKITKVKQTIVSLSSIKSFLEEKGFSVQSNVNPNLKYTIATNFDLVARNQDHTILLIILGSDIEENFAKMVDLDTVSKIMPGRISKYAVIFSEPREVTRSLVKRFGIVTILVDNVNKMLEKFKENYTENVKLEVT
jgi:CheY-like chemotaxis protein/Zn finger protein HypA/HybF involved in hydrogenase expression